MQRQYSRVTVKLWKCCNRLMFSFDLKRQIDNVMFVYCPQVCNRYGSVKFENTEKNLENQESAEKRPSISHRRGQHKRQRFIDFPAFFSQGKSNNSINLSRTDFRASISHPNLLIIYLLLQFLSLFNCQFSFLNKNSYQLKIFWPIQNPTDHQSSYNILKSKTQKQMLLQD